MGGNTPHYLPPPGVIGNRLAAQNTPPTPVCGMGGVIVIRTCAAQRGARGVSSVIVLKVVQLVVQQAKSIEMHVDRNYLKEILISGSLVSRVTHDLT